MTGIRRHQPYSPEFSRLLISRYAVELRLVCFFTRCKRITLPALPMTSAGRFSPFARRARSPHALVWRGSRVRGCTSSCRQSTRRSDRRLVWTQTVRTRPVTQSGIKEPGPISAIDVSTQALATAAQLRNRGLQQEEILARLARIEPDDRTTLCGEC
jgi:hypothetical protein